MNSKLRDTIWQLIKNTRREAAERQGDDIERLTFETDKAEKAIRQAVGEEMLEILDGLEVDMEATEKHIRKAMASSSEDDIAYRLMSANIDADDRKDTLDDVRQKIKEWSEEPTNE